MPRIKPLLFPGGVMFLAVVAAQAWDRLPPSARPLLNTYCWFILALGLLLAWGFQRGRVGLALLLLALAAEVLQRQPAGPGKTATALMGPATELLAILLPLNLAALACLEERGFWTPRGFARLGLILGQAGGVLLAGRFPCSPLAAAVHYRFFHPAWLLQTPLHQPALLAFAAAGILLLIQFYRKPRPIEAGFAAALAGAFLALHLSPGGLERPDGAIFIAAAQTVLVSGLLLTSHAMAYRDELTGLASRRAMNEFLPQLGRHYSIAMVDVDHFKKFNDRYGHDAGDQVLRLVASKLAHPPASGRSFRYGGEEFTIIYPGRSLEEAGDASEYLRQAIEQTAFQVRGPQRPQRARQGRPLRGSSPATSAGQVRITVSIGVAEACARLADPEAVIKAADKALYRAKKGGRNQVSD